MPVEDEYAVGNQGMSSGFHTVVGLGDSGLSALLRLYNLCGRGSERVSTCSVLVVLDATGSCRYLALVKAP